MTLPVSPALPLAIQATLWDDNPWWRGVSLFGAHRRHRDGIGAWQATRPVAGDPEGVSWVRESIQHVLLSFHGYTVG